MALFGKVKINFGLSDKPVRKEPTLYEMANEKFGKDKRLMMEIDLFLAQKRRIKQLPSRIAWGYQLNLLEKYPEEQRLEQVMRSIRHDYRSIAYETNLPKESDVKRNNEDEEVVYSRGF